MKKLSNKVEVDYRRVNAAYDNFRVARLQMVQGLTPGILVRDFWEYLGVEGHGVERYRDFYDIPEEVVPMIDALGGLHAYTLVRAHYARAGDL